MDSNFVQNPYLGVDRMNIPSYRMGLKILLLSKLAVISNVLIDNYLATYLLEITFIKKVFIGYIFVIFIFGPFGALILLIF